MNSLQVLYIAAELTPFTGSSARAKENHFLARALGELGLEVTLVVPGYAVAEPARFGLARRLSPLTLPGDPEPLEIPVHEGSLPGGRASLVVIGLPGSPPGDGASAPSDIPNPAAFIHAAVTLAEQQGAWPDVVIAGHGCEPAMPLVKTRADAHDLPAPITLFTLRQLEDSPSLRDALAHSDRIVVPSRQWLESLGELPERDPVMQLLGPIRHALRGVCPGTDPVEWNPGHDGHMARGFARDPQAGKAHHKQELQRSLGLKQQPRTPLVAVLAPVDGNIMSYVAASALGQKDLQLVVLATPDDCVGHGVDTTGLPHLERLANQSPSRVTIRSFSDPEERRAFEHNLMAGADFVLFARAPALAPLSELYCMHYGTIPIAPTLGCFAETLVEFDSVSATGSGFVFSPDKHDALAAAVERATRAYVKPESFAALIGRAMEMDLSWRTTAQRYGHILAEVLHERRRASQEQAAAAIA